MPSTRPATVDRAWADELAAQARAYSVDARAYSTNAFDYARIADDARFDALNSLNSLNLDLNLNNSFAFSDFAPLTSYNNFSFASGGGPVAWAHDDPADSLYKIARDAFSRGDYRRAADLFKSLPTRFTNSAYVADAQYWQAFSLYRIGGTPEPAAGAGGCSTRGSQRQTRTGSPAEWPTERDPARRAPTRRR